MLARVCWKCGVNAQMVVLNDPVRLPPYGGEATAALECAHCKNVNIAVVPFPDKSALHRHAFAARADHGRWFPARVDVPDLTAAPPLIGAAAREAFLAKSAGAPRAAVIMARAVIEAIAKDQGVVGKLSLYQKIETMAENRTILDRTKDAAHAVRNFGNDMAHGDFSEDDASAEDLEDTLAIMMDLIDQIYTGAARTERLRARRT